MSVVVAIKKDGVVYMGADSQVTRGGTRISLSNPNNFKIWKVKNVPNCLMGHVGTIRDACVIRIINDMVDEIDIINDNINFEFVVTKIVPKIIKTLIYNGFLKEDKILEVMDSSFLFAYKDKLFLINSDYSVIEIDDCVAIGSGENEAIGSLITTSKDDDSVCRIVKSIKSSAVHDIYVDYPIVLGNTKETELRIIDEHNIEKILK